MDLEDVIKEQYGVIARRQVLACGGIDNLVERMLRRRIWRTVHPGVYADQPGVLSEEQAHVAAVLCAWPAALAGESALVAHGASTAKPPSITVAIDHGRRVRTQPGMRILRLSELDDKVMWNRMPARLRLEVAVLQVASQRLMRRGEASAVAVLADSCQQRLTTARRLLTALGDLPSLSGRRFLRLVLADIATGAFSVLEHRYLTQVERAHGLPSGMRQGTFHQGERRGFRDVNYAEQGLLVELDGRLGHEWAKDQWADLERDLLSATEALQTIRLGWGAVDAACRVAPMLGLVLQRRGWTGAPNVCRTCASG